jgi:hypothetical protein
MTAVAGFAVSGVLFAAIYLAFAGKTSPGEIAVAVCGGLFAAALGTALARVGRSYGERIADIVRLAPGIILSIIRDAGRLTLAFAGLALGRPLHGVVDQRPFDPGPGDADGRSRRGVVVAGVAMAPNSVVLGIRHETRRLLVHELLPERAQRDPQWPL